MKKLVYTLLAMIALGIASSCKDNGGESNIGPLQNTIQFYSGCDMTVYNGESMGVMYWCDFATTAEIVITDSDNNVLQELSFQLKEQPPGLCAPGYYGYRWTIDVGDYLGKATFKMTYEDLKESGSPNRVSTTVSEMDIVERGAATLDGLKATRMYEEVAHFSVVVENADMLAFTCTPAAEYVKQSVEEVFEKSWHENMQEYGMDWGGGFENPKTYTQMINKLTPDTEYVLQVAVKNDFSEATQNITFRTKAPEPKIPDVEFLNLSVVSNTANAITLAAEIANTEQLCYHICKGDACDCEFELYMASLISVWHDNGESFEKPITVTFEIKNLQPNTSYYIDVHAGARYSSQKRTIVVTTAQAE